MKISTPKLFPRFACGFEDKSLYFCFHLINLDYEAILFNNGIYFAWDLISQNVWYTGDMGLKSTLGIKYICSNKFKCINKHAGYSAGLSELVSLWYSYIKTMVSSFQVTCNIITSSIYSSGQWLLVKQCFNYTVVKVSIFGMLLNCTLENV